MDWTTLGGYFQRLERQHMATNIASYVGEEQVWTYVKGYGQSAATQDELDAMKRLIAQAMEEGAMGLSTALLEPPSSLATTDNLIELAKVAKHTAASMPRISATKASGSSRPSTRPSRSAGAPASRWTSST